MPDQVERKFIPLAELKMGDGMPGSIEGYRSVFGVIDSGGDVIVKGAFAGSADEYMHSGFSAHSHIWDFKDAVGYPVEAHEDEHGWFVKSEFHTTQGAQDVRTIARERMKAGKQVGFSFGYKTDDFQIIEQKDFKDQLPQFIKADRLEEELKKAQSFSRIRILKKVSAIEDSLVTSPMNKLAAATSVKSEPLNTESKALFEDAISEREQSYCFLHDALCTATWRAEMLAEAGAGDLSTLLDEILTEFSARWKAAVMGDSMPEMEMMADSSPISFKGDLRDRLPFAKHAETALGAVEVFAHKGDALAEILNGLTERVKAIQELRESKAGATYSSSNLNHMKRIHDTMKNVRKTVNAMHDDMAALIDKAKKPEKSDDSFDVAALRTQSMRLEGEAITALSQ